MSTDLAAKLGSIVIAGATLYMLIMGWYALALLFGPRLPPDTEKQEEQ